MRLLATAITMTEITPPYDFPPRPDSTGEQIENILGMFRMWLRRHPVWVPVLERFARYLTK